MMLRIIVTFVLALSTSHAFSDTDCSNWNTIDFFENATRQDVEFCLNSGSTVSADNVLLGWTPLHTAAGLGNAEAIKLLVERKADIEARNMLGQTPLHRAAIGGNAEAIKLLVERKANIEAREIDGQTPLHLAASTGKTEAIKVLITLGANTKARNASDNTPYDLIKQNEELIYSDAYWILHDYAFD